MPGLRVLAGAAALLGLSACGSHAAPGPPPLALERTIPLPGVGGRVDHMAIDGEGRRLFVAELGNGSVEAIDLATGRPTRRIGGLKEPQGVGYIPRTGELAVATGGDGTVRFYRAADLTLTASLKLGEDADDVRVDPATGRLLVAYGHALAVIDPAGHRIVRSIPLPAHPEGFEAQQARAFVNLPEADAVAVVDLAHGDELARWRNRGAHFNFPLALRADAREVAVVYRLPARLVLFTAAGKMEQKLAACGDADDIFFSRAQTRLYVTCGSGAVDVFDHLASGYAPARRISTRPGARTGLYSERLDRLFVAARAQGSEPAAILVYRPQ